MRLERIQRMTSCQKDLPGSSVDRPCHKTSRSLTRRACSAILFWQPKERRPLHLQAAASDLNLSLWLLRHHIGHSTRTADQSSSRSCYGATLSRFQKRLSAPPISTSLPQRLQSSAMSTHSSALATLTAALVHSWRLATGLAGLYLPLRKHSGLSQVSPLSDASVPCLSPAAYPPKTLSQTPNPSVKESSLSSPRQAHASQKHHVSCGVSLLPLSWRSEGVPCN